MADFTKTTFHALEKPSSELVAAALHALDSLPADKQSLLDLGCGTGGMLCSIAQEHTHAKLTGIDISAKNTAIARVAAQPWTERLSVITGDYMTTPLPQSGVILSDSTLQLIDAPFAALAEKICRELEHGGILCITVPVPCLYNTVLLAVRRLLIRMDSRILRELLSLAGRFLYPGMKQVTLKERIEYMFIIPNFLFSEKEKPVLNALNMHIIEIKPCSFFWGKPKHKLFLIKKC